MYCRCALYRGLQLKNPLNRDQPHPLHVSQDHLDHLASPEFVDQRVHQDNLYPERMGHLETPVKTVLPEVQVLQDYLDNKELKVHQELEFQAQQVCKNN